MNPSCLYCHAQLQKNLNWSKIFLKEKNQWLCDECEGMFEKIGEQVCIYCSRESEEEYCSDCVKWKGKYGAMLSGNRSIFKYNEQMKQYMSQFKFAGDYILVQFFAEEFKRMTKGMQDVIFVPVPLSEQRLYERGFNQSEAILREAKRPITHCLKRIDNEKQSKKSRVERLNMERNFQVTKNISGEKIVIIDDIYTTGATIHQVAACLKEAGAQTIQSITIARS